jgi:hypothetical protein
VTGSVGEKSKSSFYRTRVHASAPPRVFRATARNTADTAGSIATARAPDPGPSRRCLRACATLSGVRTQWSARTLSGPRGEPAHASAVRRFE